MEFIPIDEQRDEFSAMCHLFYGKNEMHNFCLLKDDMPVLLVGMKEVWRGVYDTYILFSKSWKPLYYRPIIRAAKGYFDFLDYDRIQHLVRCERPWTHKMARAFGFVNETPDGMQKYMGGKDYFMYAIVREDGRS